jgi:methionyl-tRNA formyltransferase
MHIVFCGTPEFAVPTLKFLLGSPEFKIVGVISQPDRPRGRGQLVSPSPVKMAAAAAGIPVHQPVKIQSDDSFDWLAGIAPEAVVIIAYGQIIPQRLLTIPRHGWINLHASLLPKYRGAAPINWAIANGESRTGLTTMRIDTRLDTGEILIQQEVAIGPRETAPELAARMAEAGAPLMEKSLLGLRSGSLTPRPQDHSAATYAPLLKRQDGRIPWALTAVGIYNRIRGFAPWPGAFTTFRRRLCQLWGTPSPGTTPAPVGRIFTVDGDLFVACGSGTLLRLESVKLEGRKRVDARDFASGVRLKDGESFGP